MHEVLEGCSNTILNYYRLSLVDLVSNLYKTEVLLKDILKHFYLQLIGCIKYSGIVMLLQQKQKK